MKVTSDRYNYCRENGNKTEQLFKDRVQKLGLKYRKASETEDMYWHIDCYVNGHGVDVKGDRYKTTIWLEMQNVRGEDGWLKGRAKYIAMYIVDLDIFSIYNREDLLKYVEENVTRHTDSKRPYHMFYSRTKWGKKDIVTKVRYQDIKHLELKAI